MTFTTSNRIILAMVLGLFAMVQIFSEFQRLPNGETMEQVTPKSSEHHALYNQTNVTTNTTTNATHHHHKSRRRHKRSALQMAMDADPSLDLADYTWESPTSERWIPPQNAPHLTRREMLQVFSKENTLWIGDSTARQDYHTLLSLLWQPLVSDDYLDVGSLDFVDSNPENHTEYLNKNINHNFHSYNEKELICKARHSAKFDETYKKYMLNLGLLADQDSQEQCSTSIQTTTTTTSIKRLPSTGNHDVAKSKEECYNVTQAKMEEHKCLLEQYSVLVISTGIYYTTFSKPCSNHTGSLKEQTYQILDYLRDELASPSRTVIWKVFGWGFHAGHRAIDQELAEASRSWFQDNPNAIGMELADFQYAVRERTEGDSRIEGDSKYHWGLSARLLSLDLVARIVARTSAPGIHNHNNAVVVFGNDESTSDEYDDDEEGSEEDDEYDDDSSSSSSSEEDSEEGEDEYDDDSSSSSSEEEDNEEE